MRYLCKIRTGNILTCCTFKITHLKHMMCKVFNTDVQKITYERVKNERDFLQCGEKANSNVYSIFDGKKKNK